MRLPTTIATNATIATIVLVASHMAACDDGEPTVPGPTVNWVVGGLDFDAALAVDRTQVPVQRVSLGADGFLVIWEAEPDGSRASTPLVAKYLTKGEHNDLVIPLDRALETETIYISLHSDAPADQVFVPTNLKPNATMDPVTQTADGTVVAALIALNNLTPLEPNRIAPADQNITSRPPRATFRVTTDDPPLYVVVTNATGEVLDSGRAGMKGTQDVLVTLPSVFSNDPIALTASLFEANGNAPDLSKPVLNLAGQPVTRAFAATTPSNNILNVADQTLESFGYKIAIAGADLEQLPAWVAIYEDNNGAPGALLGHDAVTGVKVAWSIDLTRFVRAPSETLWIAAHADTPADGELTAADPYLDGPDGQPLLVAIVVTNASCDGLKTKFCDPAKPNVINWRDRCDAVSSVTTDCGDGTCQDTGSYVKCLAPPNPCLGVSGKSCQPGDPEHVYILDGCGEPKSAGTPCGSTSLCAETSANDAECVLVEDCDGNGSSFCSLSDLGKVFFKDHCGNINGNAFSCPGASECSDVDEGARCTPSTTPGCEDPGPLVCDTTDTGNLYETDSCGTLTGGIVFCGLGYECAASAAGAFCQAVEPCSGGVQKVCAPDNLTVISLVDGCGKLKNSSIPCGANRLCEYVEGVATCVGSLSCGGLGSIQTVCDPDDPSNVYWLDGCGVPTGATYPCGVATCVMEGGVGSCTLINTCQDLKQRHCDPSDPSTILLSNGCGDDLGVFDTCVGGQKCTEEVVGDALCACVPTEQGECFWDLDMYGDTGIRSIDTCGYSTDTVLQACGNGETCKYSATGEPECTTSLNDTSGPMGHRGCSFPSYVLNKTDLLTDCRCRRHPADPTDFYANDTSGNVNCMNQHSSLGLGYSVGDGPAFGHMLHHFWGGGIYSPSHNEVFATMQYTSGVTSRDGMVVAFNIDTGARRIVSGRYPGPAGTVMYGSGYQTGAETGEVQPDALTLQGAWDVEMGPDSQLYVWGSKTGTKEITRVDPDSGERTLVWKQKVEGATTASPFGQCNSNRLKSTYFDGIIPVSLEAHAFAMDPDGSFYLGFRNSGNEGNGIVRISSDGLTCTVVSRWNSDPIDMPEVGGGSSPQYSTIEGFGIHQGKLYAVLEIGGVLIEIDLVTGDRVATAGSLTPGQSSMFFDPDLGLLITGGSHQSYTGVAVDIATGIRQPLFLVGPGQPLLKGNGVLPHDVNAHGAIDNGNYQGFGALVMDPDDKDNFYMVIKWGLLKYEMSTGNSYVVSQ